MIGIIKQLFKMNIKTWSEYRMDFFIGITAVLVSNLTSIVLFWIIFSHVTTINNWTLDQMFFLLGLYFTSLGLWHVFLQGPMPHRIERYIVNGELDGLLLRPVNTLSLLILSKIDDDGIGDLIAGLLLLLYASNALSIVWSVQNIVLIISTVLGSVLIIFSLMLLLTSAGFWVIKSSILTNLLYPIMRFIEFPLEIYNPFIIFILTFVLPLGFINYYPAQLFLSKGSITFASYLTLFVGIVFFSIAYKLWKFGLKNYSSTGS